ncbi:AraC family transcriptional regulator [Nocardia callitridis]|uniref:HTH araC/xylS-type domain-containing protein n=1 Tax=Nocardia callitridis TaxID=648753 RepID=A0ABP9JZX7_9NOCA
MTTTSLATPLLTVDLVEQRIPVPESLRQWFTEAGQIPIARDRSVPLAHIPQAATTIALRTEYGRPRAALVIGPQTRATYPAADKPVGALRLRVAPGAVRSLLGISALALTDRAIRLADLPGPLGRAAPELLTLPTDKALDYLADQLPRLIREQPTQRTHRELLTTAVAALTGTPLGKSVHELAVELAVSERQLRNLFSTGIGVSPKHFARIDRIRRVVTGVGTTPWAQLATATGYFDQSHMTSDFRTLMGVAPTSYLRGAVPPPNPCMPLSRPIRLVE